MSLVLEKKVQDVAHAFLEKKYARKASGKKFFSQKEMRTKAKYGSKRADGFLAFNHWLWGKYVVSMEAKSRKTLPAIRPYRDDFIFVKNSTWAGFLFCVVTGSFYALFKMEDGLFQFLIPMYAWIFGALGYALLTWSSARHQTMDVIDQLKQYPANEQWLSFSRDSFEALKKKDQVSLKKICKARGIGLMIVGRRTTVLSKPKMRWIFFGDFLKYYSKEKQIRQFLQ